MAKTAVIVVSDLHTNSTVGLSPPSVSFDDGESVRAKQMRRQLWRWWLDFCEWSSDISKGYRKIAVINGDLVDIDYKNRSKQVISRNISDVTKMAASTLEPLFDVTDAAIIIRGTEAHTGGNGEMEEEIAKDHSGFVIENEESNTFSWQVYQGETAGVTFEIMHHTTMGRLFHTQRNAANKNAANARSNYLDAGFDAPDVVIRSHVHRYSDSGKNYKTFAVTTPAWCWHPSYVFRIGDGVLPAEIGGMVFLCEDGQFTHHLKMYELPKSRRSIWKKKF